MNTCEQTQRDIAVVIQAAAPQARVFAWWALVYDVPQWAALLRSELDGQKAHAWLVTRRQTLPLEKAARCIEWQWQFSINGFYAYDAGAPGRSEFAFAAECDAVAAALTAANPALPESLQRSSGISFSFSILPAGAELLHVAEGQFLITAC